MDTQTNLTLQQRNAELAMLNSVGEAMVKTLDVKTMTRLVGDSCAKSLTPTLCSSCY